MRKPNVSEEQRREAIAHAIKSRQLYRQAVGCGIQNEPNTQNMVQQTQLLMLLADVTDEDVDRELERT